MRSSFSPLSLHVVYIVKHIHTHVYIYIHMYKYKYIYIYICVGVCVCVTQPTDSCANVLEMRTMSLNSRCLEPQKQSSRDGRERSDCIHVAWRAAFCNLLIPQSLRGCVLRRAEAHTVLGTCAGASTFGIGPGWLQTLPHRKLQGQTLCRHSSTCYFLGSGFC